jgi:hypothetical protein
MRPVRLAALLLLVGVACEGSDGATDGRATSDAGPPPERCPSHLRFTFLVGNRTDVGWTGNAHGSTFARDAFFRVEVTECDDECRRCAFRGPVRDDTVITQRCVSDPAQVCRQDADCPDWECRELIPGAPGSPRVCAHDSGQSCQSPADCGPGACRFFVGPPFPLLAPRTCLGAYLDSTDGRPPVLGNIDLRTGAVQLDRLRIVSGATDSAVQGACPKCLGDAVPNDGQEDGRCVQNDVTPAFPYALDQSCDAHGVGQPDIFDGTYSLDCSTPLGVRIQVGLEDGSTSGRRFQLTSNQPRCGGQRCWCGVCEGSLEPCRDAGDCRGVACVTPDEVPPRPNACIDGCAWDPETQRGRCMTQDPPRNPGDPLPPPRPISCFPEGEGAEIVAPGRAEVLSDTSYSVEIGHLACRRPVRAVFPGPVSLETDRQIGLPGLQLNVLRFQIDQEFQ